MKKTILFALGSFALGVVVGAAIKDPVSRKYTIIRRNLKTKKDAEQ